MKEEEKNVTNIKMKKQMQMQKQKGKIDAHLVHIQTLEEYHGITFAASLSDYLLSFISLFSWFHLSDSMTKNKVIYFLIYSAILRAM